MLILVLLAVLTLVGGALLWWSVRLDTMFPSVAGLFLVALGVGGFIVCGIVIPVRHGHQSASIEEYRELQRTVQTAGVATREMEDIYGQVVSMNRFLARARYWNESSWTDIFWSDDFAALPPIELAARRE